MLSFCYNNFVKRKLNHIFDHLGWVIKLFRTKKITPVTIFQLTNSRHQTYYPICHNQLLFLCRVSAWFFHVKTSIFYIIFFFRDRCCPPVLVVKNLFPFSATRITIIVDWTHWNNVIESFYEYNICSDKCWLFVSMGEGFSQMGCLSNVISIIFV